MEYTEKQMEYINSVDGNAHQSAVEIIGKLEDKLRQAEKEIEELRAFKEKVMSVEGVLPEYKCICCGGENMCKGDFKNEAIKEALPIFQKLQGEIEELKKSRLSDYASGVNNGVNETACEYKAKIQSIENQLAEKDRLFSKTPKIYDVCSGGLGKNLYVTCEEYNKLKSDLEQAREEIKRLEGIIDKQQQDKLNKMSFNCLVCPLCGTAGSASGPCYGCMEKENRELKADLKKAKSKGLSEQELFNIYWQDIKMSTAPSHLTFIEAIVKAQEGK